MLGYFLWNPFANNCTVLNLRKKTLKRILTDFNFVVNIWLYDNSTQILTNIMMGLVLTKVNYNLHSISLHY